MIEIEFTEEEIRGLLMLYKYSIYTIQYLPDLCSEKNVQIVFCNTYVTTDDITNIRSAVKKIEENS